MQKNRRKVVVTGVSAIAPNGIGWRDFWTNSLSGVSGCREITGFPITDGFSKVAGVVNNFYPESKFSIDDMGLPSNRLSLLAEFAVREALDEAGLLHDNQIRAGYEKTALCLSSAIGQMGSMESAYLKEYVYHQQADQYEMDSFSFSDITRRIVQLFGLQGGHTVIPTGCVGGCDAVSYGVHSIRVGRENRVIVGAAEAPITPLVLAAFGRIGANSTRACLPHEASCPFDMGRDGFVIGEGAGILILEDEISALERGATIWAEVKGTGSVCNAYHMTDLHPSG
ncbi:MAG: beta-ketoacyl synthase N-terminal-like domain-containing protein, partial [Gammaproteobacteria bacterium]